MAGVNIFRAVAVLVLLAPAVALAQGTAGAATGGEAVQSVISAILSQSQSLISGSPFLAQGQRLLQLLLMILISWKGIKLALDVSGFNEIVAEIIQIVLLWGIASFFLTATVQKQFTDGFDDLAKTAASATGANLNMSKPEAAIADSLGRMMDAAMKLYDGVPPESTSKGSTWDKFTAYLSETWDSLKSGQIFASIAAVIFRAFIAVAVLITALIYVGQLIMSQIMVNIGLIMAPILVPWIMWESTSFLFHGWVKFMIVAGVQKIVGALLFGLTASMVTHVTTLATSATATPSLNFYYYAAAFLVVALMAFMMMQITSIANGLVSGMPSTAFKPPMKMTPGGGLNAAGGMNVGKTAATAGKGMVSGAQAGMRAGKAYSETIKAGGSRMEAAKAAGSAARAAPPKLPKAAAGGE